MKKLIALFFVCSCVLALVGCAKPTEECEATNLTSAIDDTTTAEPKNQSEVFQFLSDKYNLAFRLWGPVENDLYVYHVYPDHADYECYMMMPEKTDDVEQYQKNLSWKIEDDKLIITSVGGEWTETFTIDISTETATSTRTDRVYEICEIEPPLE